MARRDSRRQVQLTTAAAVERWLVNLDPRQRDHFVYDVPNRALAWPLLRGLTASQRLLATVTAGLVLRPTVEVSWGDKPPAVALGMYLSERFPPEIEVPVVGADWVAPMREIALGEPGEPVAYGLFPSTPTKLARLALARSGLYPADVVRRAAEGAYGPDRSHLARSYHAHDAFACALVHPEVDATELVDRYLREEHGRLGWRSRRKTHRLIVWARWFGYLVDESPICPCGHDAREVPTTQAEALALAYHQKAIKHLLVVVEQDPARWLGVFKCIRCGRYWAEDSMTSGHADMFFIYPIETDDPHAWLVQAQGVKLRSC
jgi:hypothetical protein